MLFIANPAAIPVVVLVIKHKRLLLRFLESPTPPKLIVRDKVRSELILFAKVCFVWCDLDALVRQECDLIKCFLFCSRIDNEFTSDANQTI